MVVHSIDSEAGNGEDEEEDDDDDCDGDVALDHFGWGQSEIVVDGEVVVRSIIVARKADKREKSKAERSRAE
ncbi:hypothetical protein N7467_011137 [Penicillium canescens]|nr:hypothetical protein N7467_011137 [Penicillium canescens]